MANASWMVTGLSLLAAATATAESAAPPSDYLVCHGPDVIYCNDFDTNLDGIDHEADVETVFTPTLTGFGSALAATLDADAVGASWDVRFAGEEQVYVRFYVQFSVNWTEPMHHFFAIHGDANDNQYSCHGTAGCRPDGTSCLDGTTVDSRETVTGQLPGEPYFYTYFPEMACTTNCDVEAVCADCAAHSLACNDECCYGNHFNLNQSEPVSMQQLTWYAIETMVKANTAGQADGEMALWIDGTLVAHHTGLHWRDTSALQLNHFQVWNYYPEATEAYQVWFDNLVISRAPIGLIDEPNPGGGGFDGGSGPDAGNAADDPLSDGGTCGCSASSAGLGLVLAVLGLRRRRRR